MMNKYGIYHSTDVPYAYGVENGLNLRIRTARGDINKVLVYYKDKYDKINNSNDLI